MLLTNSTMDDHAGKNTFNHRHHRCLQLSTPLRFWHLMNSRPVFKSFLHIETFYTTQRICVFQNQTLYEWTTGSGQNWGKGELCHLSVLPPLPIRVTCQTFGWQQAALSVLPGHVLPQPLRLVSLQLQICLPCTYVPLGSALRASDVTKQLASEWKWHYILESSTSASCVILMIPVLRIDNISHKGGRDNACF